ncbi:RICIN domain-containing protein [Actinoplanes sp. NPDC026623]|uniref:RICIN domain-containing protein n=1 Tax=Actinoplanes sp. NPDC026623 TaxID=3155610 RepID=UPI0033F7C86C
MLRTPNAIAAVASISASATAARAGTFAVRSSATSRRSWMRIRALVVAIVALTAVIAVAPQAASAAGDGSMTISNAYTDGAHCLNYDDGVVYLDECSVNGSTRWFFAPNPDSIVNNYRLIPRGVGVNNFCLTQPDKSNAHVMVSWCNGAQNQSWTISYNGPANRITNDNSGKCLDASYDSAGTVTAWTCYNPLTRNQQWFNA